MAQHRLNLFFPLAILLAALIYLPITILHLVVNGQYRKILRLKALRDAWFQRFLIFFGPRSRDLGAPFVKPLLARAHGVVLDIGPGDGQWVNLFLRNRGGAQISRIYGVEPNKELHSALRRRVYEAGLEDLYEIVPQGVEDLDYCGVVKGSVDTIVTVQVLCSVPDPQGITKELYSYLKPGGQWLVYEHVKTKFAGTFVAWWQASINLVWPHIFNGCDITRPTDVWLLQAGEWSEIDLQSGEGEGRYCVVPYALGRLGR